MQSDQWQPEPKPRQGRPAIGRGSEQPSSDRTRAEDDREARLRRRDDPDRVAEQGQARREPAEGGVMRPVARSSDPPERPEPEGHRRHVRPRGRRGEREGPRKEVCTAGDQGRPARARDAAGQCINQSECRQARDHRGEPRRPDAVTEGEVAGRLQVEPQGGEGIERLVGVVVDRRGITRGDVRDLRQAVAEDRHPWDAVEVLVLPRPDPIEQRQVPGEEDRRHARHPAEIPSSHRVVTGVGPGSFGPHVGPFPEQPAIIAARPETRPPRQLRLTASRHYPTFSRSAPSGDPSAPNLRRRDVA